MVRSRLPLLGLFGALLMLSPELLTGISGTLSVVPTTDPEVQKAFTFAVEQYNQVIDCRNYFKQMRLLEALTENRICDFKVAPRSPPNKTILTIGVCTLSSPGNKRFCIG